MRMLLITALAFAAPVAAGTAHAQGYGYLPAPAYAYGGGYEGGHGGRFTLAGARAGITVLGIDLDGSANLKIGLHDHHGGGRQVVYAQPPQPVYAPAPEVNSGGYGYVSAGYGQGYAQTYATQTYVAQDYSGAAYGCGQCAPPPPPPCGCVGGW